jgi:hypothetical protein
MSALKNNQNWKKSYHIFGQVFVGVSAERQTFQWFELIFGQEAEQLSNRNIKLKSIVCYKSIEVFGTEMNTQLKLIFNNSICINVEVK